MKQTLSIIEMAIMLFVAAISIITTFLSRRRKTNIFLVLLSLTSCTMLFCDITINLLSYKQELFATVKYVLGYVYFVILFFSLAAKIKRSAYIYIYIALILICASIGVSIIDYSYSYSLYFYLAAILVSIIYLLKLHDEKKYISFLFFSVLILITVMMIVYSPIDYLPLSFSTVTIFVFIKSRIDEIEMYNFQEQELNKAQVQLLMSQIQPHFLFNALSAISNTYRSDPMKAADAIDDFSNYLRGNIKSIGSNNKILFKEELKHVNYYLNLEKLRFGDEIEVIYDINNVNFYVPTLTIEPLVENSIKHGLNRKHSKGYVKIAAYSEGNNNVIQIEDNGAGFDINSLDENDNDHIGIKNARKRIELISKGTLSIESKINYGTKITIKIPKGGK